MLGQESFVYTVFIGGSLGTLAAFLSFGEYVDVVEHGDPLHNHVVKASLAYRLKNLDFERYKPHLHASE